MGIFLTRAVEPIDNVINAFGQIIFSIFSPNGYFVSLVSFIVNSPYLLISLSLIVCGFVFGILNRLISL